MIRCGAGNRIIQRPSGDNYVYSCSFTELFKTVTEIASTTPAVNETIVLSVSLDIGFYILDFSCGAENTHGTHNPTAIIRAWLDFGLPSVLTVNKGQRYESKIDPIGVTKQSFFMLRSSSRVFEVTSNGTILSITFESSASYTDINLYNKVLNVFKVNNYTNININS